VDVGRNQLHERMKSHPRVTWQDGVNVRDLSPTDLAFPCSLVVADLSFISLTKVLRALVDVVSPEADHETAQLLLLVKPQFEAGRMEVARGRGVITDPLIHQAACDGVAQHLESLGAVVRGVTESPIKGAEGNTEFLMFVECPTVSVGYEV
jgi:23S rRNA (cytidine1920-2'-O)/16S rRNA (cytidine1409-2'-O)-methyltransferase